MVSAYQFAESIPQTTAVRKIQVLDPKATCCYRKCVQITKTEGCRWRSYHGIFYDAHYRRRGCIVIQALGITGEEALQVKIRRGTVHKSPGAYVAQIIRYARRYPIPAILMDAIATIPKVALGVSSLIHDNHIAHENADGGAAGAATVGGRDRMFGGGALVGGGRAADLAGAVSGRYAEARRQRGVRSTDVGYITRTQRKSYGSGLTIYEQKLLPAYTGKDGRVQRCHNAYAQ